MKMWRWLVQDRISLFLITLNLLLLAWIAHPYLTAAAKPKEMGKQAKRAALSPSAKSGSQAAPVSLGSSEKSASEDTKGVQSLADLPQKGRARPVATQAKANFENILRHYIPHSGLKGEQLEQVLDLLASRATAQTPAERSHADEALAQRVGQDGLALIDYHIGTRILRGQLAQLEAVLAPGSSPLTPYQIEQLIALWAANHPQTTDKKRSPVRLPDKIDESSLDAAARFLDETQLATLQRFAAAREAVKAMQETPSH